MHKRNTVEIEVKLYNWKALKTVRKIGSKKPRWMGFDSKIRLSYSHRTQFLSNFSKENQSLCICIFDWVGWEDRDIRRWHSDKTSLMFATKISFSLAFLSNLILHWHWTAGCSNRRWGSDDDNNRIVVDRDCACKLRYCERRSCFQVLYLRMLKDDCRSLLC